MSDNVIPLRPLEPDYDGITCRCGSAWFRADGVALDKGGKVTGYTTPLCCVECDAKWTPPLPVIGV